jgi:hypothetical protein
MLDQNEERAENAGPEAEFGENAGLLYRKAVGG